MPRSGTRLVSGIAAGLLVAACGPPLPSAIETPPPPTPTPSATPATSARTSGWTEELTFSGDFAGLLNQVLPAETGTRSECTGRNSKTAGAWASSLFGFVGPQVYGVAVSVPVYRGPATYSGSAVSVQVHKPDNSAVWQSRAGDQATFTVAEDEESGRLDASLTNLSNNSSKLMVAGRWSCRT